VALIAAGRHAFMRKESGVFNRFRGIAETVAHPASNLLAPLVSS
jgi:hypothetical protein